MHPIEAEKQRQYKWWLDLFLPAGRRQGGRDERYRLGLLVVAMFVAIGAGLFFAIQSASLPISWVGRVCVNLMPLSGVLVLAYVRWTGDYQKAALSFGLFGSFLMVAYILTLKTVYIGLFYWIPWIIVFVSFLVGRRQGALVGIMTLLQTTLVLRWNGVYGHSLGAYRSFDELFAYLLQNQVLSMLAVTAVMFTFALYNDRMESELELQHVSRAQTAHKTMIGEMLGNLAHEVNNPLAIVHTALLHYRRLLETQRLEKSMQRGLIQRIEDALDRLRRVVEDLNSSADWTDLEVPRSYASLQSDQERPPQYGSLRSFANPEGTRSGERRRQGIYRLIRRTFDILDRTLPQVTRTWSTSQRFRARTTALICSTGLVTILMSLAQLYNERAPGYIMHSGHLFLLIGIGSMIVLKFTARPQIMGAGYLMLLYAVTVGIAAQAGHSVLMPALHWFPLMIIGLFLVTRPKPALILSLIIVIGDMGLMLKLQPVGLQISFSQTFPQYLMRLHSTLVLSNFTVVVLSAAFISLMNSTHGLLMAEKDWHLLSARMRELSELADSAAILIGEPLKTLDQLRRELQIDGQNLDLLSRMQFAVQRINRVSQSFALLSRPKANEGHQSIEGRIWMEHIENIAFRRAADAGWILSTEIEPEHLVIEGPLGRLTMLVITCLKEAFGHRAPQAESPLRLTVRREGNFLVLSILYAATPRSDAPPDPQLELEEAMRLSLLMELLEFLQGTLQRSQDQDQITLEVRWAPQWENPRP